MQTKKFFTIMLLVVLGITTTPILLHAQLENKAVLSEGTRISIEKLKAEHWTMFLQSSDDVSYDINLDSLKHYGFFQEEEDGGGEIAYVIFQRKIDPEKYIEQILQAGVIIDGIPASEFLAEGRTSIGCDTLSYAIKIGGGFIHYDCIGLMYDKNKDGWVDYNSDRCRKYWSQKILSVDYSFFDDKRFILIGNIVVGIKEKEESVLGFSIDFYERELTYDIYGNRIRSKIGLHPLEDEYYEIVKYEVPPKFTEENVPTTTISLDLQPLDIDGVLEDIIRRRALRLVNFSGVPEYYSLYSIPRLYDDLTFNVIKPSIEGCQRVEELFGFKPGTIIKNICVNDYEDNSFSFLNPNGINLSPIKKLDLGGGIPDQEIIAKHEAFHLIDSHLSLSLDSVWQKKFKELEPGYGIEFLGLSIVVPSKFYEHLNESDFDPEDNIVGGHSNSNPAEFFASFLSSLDRDRWEEIMPKKGEDFNEKYRNVLLVLKKMVIDREELVGTPLDSLIEKRLVWLETQ